MHTLNTLAMAGMVQPTFALDFSPALTSLLQKVAFLLIAAWIAYIIMQFAMPSKRSARIKWGRVIIMGFGSVILINPDLIIQIINGFTGVIWQAGKVVAPTWFA